MTVNDRPGIGSAEGLRTQAATPAASLRDKLARRLSGMDAECPEALDLLSVMIETAASEVRGVVGLIAGPKGPDHTRRVFRGEEAGIAEEMARLAIGPTKEGRMAARAFARVLHAATESEPPLVNARETVANATEMAGRLSAEAQRAFADNIVTPEEAHSLADGIEQLEALLRSLKCAAAQTEARLTRKPVPTCR